jgi:hypothetical protein
MQATTLTERPTNQHYEALSHAARRLGLNAETLRKRIYRGQLAAFRWGKRILLRRGDADRLLQPVNAEAT